jgi:tetratricopeptide (TPR) repeat protein
VVSSLGLLLSEVPASQSQRAVERTDRGDWSAADQEARAAADHDPAIASYAMVAGLTASRAGDHAAAARYFQRVADDTDLPEAWVNLAAEQMTLSLPDTAKTSLDRAYRLGQQRSNLAMAVGDLALRAGDDELALDAFTVVLRRQPMLAGDPWWFGTPQRSDAYGRVGALLLGSSPPGVEWRLRMVIGDTDIAHRVAASQPDAAFLQVVIDAWGDQAPAIDTLVKDCYQSALDPNRLNLCANVAAHLDHQGWLDDMRRMLEVLGPGQSNEAGAVEISDNPAATDRLAGRTIPFWGVFTYRRPVPRNLIVPGVAQLILR